MPRSPALGAAQSHRNLDCCMRTFASTRLVGAGFGAFLDVDYGPPYRSLPIPVTVPLVPVD